MELCSRCHKRLPVVFITKVVNDKIENEGLCIKCARELGIKQVDAAIKQMGLTEEDIERLDVEMSQEEAEEFGMTDLVAPDDSDDGKAPSIDLRKLFGNILPGGSIPPSLLRHGGKNEGGSKTTDTVEKQKAPKKKFLEMYCLDLTKKAKDGQLDNIIGRDRELARVIQILCRRQKNNPCLIGEPGVGKTAIAEALALRIANGQVPYKLKDCEVYVVDMTALIAGTQFRGQFETRMKGLIDEVKSLGNIILVIDEIHTIASAGDAEGSMNAANILKPALSRGEIQVIGATTLNEYRKYIEKDSALERRFQPVMVEEPSIEDTVNVLLGIKKYYEGFHNIKIGDAVVRRAVELSERYITDRFLPDKAIDLLDESASHLSLSSTVNEDYEKVKSEYESVLKERETLESSEVSPHEEGALDKKYEKIAALRVTELQKKNELDRLTEEREKIELSVEDLADVIEIWTGIPASSITESEFRRLERLEGEIKSRIIGQDAAVEAVVKAIKRNRAGVSYKRKPVSFIFAGSTGVGKTELVKVLASEMFNSPESLIRLDMSEFMEKHAVSRIIGSPPGYVGYDEAGQLTEKIRRKPYSVVLFDEIEKAHPDVMNILLQILDDGRITDAHGKTVSFENTIIVMTTNAGSNVSGASAGFGISADEIVSDKTMKALSDFLRPEFLNRVDEVIVFRSLDCDDFVKIAEIMLGEVKAALAQKNILFAYTSEASAFIAEKSFDRKFGARSMRRYIQRNVEDEAARLIIESYENPVSAISLDVHDGSLRVLAV